MVTGLRTWCQCHCGHKTDPLVSPWRHWSTDTSTSVTTAPASSSGRWAHEWSVRQCCPLSPSPRAGASWVARHWVRKYFPTPTLGQPVLLIIFDVSRYIIKIKEYFCIFYRWFFYYQLFLLEIGNLGSLKTSKICNLLVLVVCHNITCFIVMSILQDTLDQILLMMLEK